MVSTVMVSTVTVLTVTEPTQPTTATHTIQGGPTMVAIWSTQATPRLYHRANCTARAKTPSMEVTTITPRPATIKLVESTQLYQQVSSLAAQLLQPTVLARPASAHLHHLRAV